MANIFTDVQVSKPSKNRFDLSHDVKISFKMGQLVPTSHFEVVPGDIFNIRIENMLRFAPLVSPVMHKIKIDTHWFFVPYRLLWSEWEDWITGEVTSSVPTVSLDSGTAVGDIGDYLGLPITSTTLEVSAFPIAAYTLIYDEYYRDQNLVGEKFGTGLVAGSGNATFETYMESVPRYRAWEHDYFTSALPFSQKGDMTTVPLTAAGNVDVELDMAATGNQTIRRAVGRAVETNNLALWVEGTSGDLEGSGGVDVVLDPKGSLYVDINEAATDITTLRRAFKLQEFLEKDARGGTRYIENILTHFGVYSSDKRLNRPEYIGGVSQTMKISEVLATAQSSDDVATAEQVVGQMNGHGISLGGSNRISYKAEEHGIIMGIISARPATAYSQGLHRQWTRTDRTDYYWPTFAHIGEQEVLNQEVYIDAATRTDTFGYVPRYAEYKYLNSRIAGLMRTDLEYWHLGRKFASEPALNQTFIECVPDTRIFADESGDHIIGHLFHQISAIRPMPVFGNPSI